LSLKIHYIQEYVNINLITFLKEFEGSKSGTNSLKNGTNGFKKRLIKRGKEGEQYGSTIIIYVAYASVFHSVNRCRYIFYTLDNKSGTIP